MMHKEQVVGDLKASIKSGANSYITSAQLDDSKRENDFQVLLARYVKTHVCMCVCMYTRAQLDDSKRENDFQVLLARCANIRSCTYTSSYMCVHVCVCVCVYIYIYIYNNVCVCVCIYIYINMREF